MNTKGNRLETERKYATMIEEVALLGVFNRQAMEKKYSVSHRAFTVMANLKWIEKISAHTYKWRLLKIDKNAAAELLDNMNLMQDVYSEHKPAKKRVVERYFQVFYYMYINKTFDIEYVMKEYKLHTSFFPVACEFNFIEKVSINTYRYIAKGVPSMLMANRMYNYIVSKSAPQRIKKRPAKRIAQHKIDFTHTVTDMKPNLKPLEKSERIIDHASNDLVIAFILGAVSVALCCWMLISK